MNLKMEVHSYRYLRTMFYSKQDSREYHKNQPLMLVWGFMTLKNCLCFICKCLPAILGKTDLTEAEATPELNAGLKKSSGIGCWLSLLPFSCTCCWGPISLSCCQQVSSLDIHPAYFGKIPPKATEQASTSRLSALLFKLWSQKASQICHVVQMIANEGKWTLYPHEARSVCLRYVFISEI